MRLWDARSGACLTSYDFGKPISSLAFFPSGHSLAVASGHKLYFWDYSEPPAPRGEAGGGGSRAPGLALETRRTLRLVQLRAHPCGLLLLTSEMNPDVPRGHPPARMSLADPGRRAAQVPPTHAGLLPAPPPPPQPGQGPPATQRLRLWRVDTEVSVENSLSCAGAGVDHSALCSENGAHLSPCGSLLAAIAVCHDDSLSARTPSTHPAHELRVYSLREGPGWGRLLHARRVRAGAAVTSLQFSPTSRLLLLSYGTTDPELLLRPRGEWGGDGGSGDSGGGGGGGNDVWDPNDFSNAAPVLLPHAAVEVYCVEGLRLLRWLPSVGDVPNVALFHPQPGRGVAYGTREGRVRLLWRREGEEREGGTEEDLLLAGAAGSGWGDDGMLVG